MSTNDKITGTEMFTANTEWNKVAAAQRQNTAVALVRLMRPRQWVKNAFVFGPLIFSSSFHASHLIGNACLAAVAFFLASSTGYIVNDINDREADRLHPLKRLQRPLASGEVSIRQAVVLLVILSTLLVALSFALPAIAPALGAYLAVTFSYSLYLKKVPVFDLFAIAFGFVIRVYAGAAAINVPLTFWMSITTLCLALYLAAMKRRQELLRSGSAARGVLTRYTPELLATYAQTAAVTSVVFYGLYIATVHQGLVLTLPLVLLGLFRYQFLSELSHGETPADVLLLDPTLLVTVASWAALCLYLVR